MTVLDIVKSKVEYLDIAEPLILVAIDEIACAIKNYCNIENIPETLKYVWANMAVDLIVYQNEVSKENALNQIGVENITAIRMGDAQVSIGEGVKNKVLNSHRPNLDTIVMNYRQHLNAHRRMVW